MAETFQLEIASPERSLVDEQVFEAELPGVNGYMTVLPDHAALVSGLGAGMLTYRNHGGRHTLVLSGGFVEVYQNHVRVLADDACHPGDINAGRAKQDLEAASKELKTAQTEEESARAFAAYQRAEARLEAASKRSGDVVEH